MVAKHLNLLFFSQVFELAGDVVPPPLAHNLMRLIAEGAGEDDEVADTELRRQAVASYLALLDTPKLPDILLQVGDLCLPHFILIFLCFFLLLFFSLINHFCSKTELRRQAVASDLALLDTPKLPDILLQVKHIFL